MTAELAKKKAAKFDAELATEAKNWIIAVLDDGDVEHELSTGQISTPDEFAEGLQDGKLLCKLINVIKPGSVKKINENKMAFKQMENIGNFLSACEALGANKIDLFQTVDLYEKQNIPQVINGIFTLGRKASKIGYDGPRLGPEEAAANPREFTEEQLRAGQGVIGLQAGTNKGASQAGQNFGKSRAIIDRRSFLLLRRAAELLEERERQQGDKRSVEERLQSLEERVRALEALMEDEEADDDEEDDRPLEN